MSLKIRPTGLGAGIDKDQPVPWRALMIASGSVIPRQDIDAARESQMTALANINP